MPYVFIDGSLLLRFAVADFCEVVRKVLCHDSRGITKRAGGRSMVMHKFLQTYWRSRSGQAGAIEKLKVRSEERATAREKWSRRDHEQLVRVLTNFEGRWTEARNLIELILDSSPKAYRHVEQGFILPCHIWRRLRSWRESQDRRDAEVESEAQ